MAERGKLTRYFENPFPDFESLEAEFVVPKEVLRSRARELVEVITSNIAVSARSDRAGLYVGLAGVAYGCYYAGTKIREMRSHALPMAQSYIAAALRIEHKNVKERRKPAFLDGASGVLAISCLISHYFQEKQDVLENLQRFAQYARILSRSDYDGPEEMLYGRAGYLQGIHILSKTLKVQVLPKSAIHALCQAVVDSGRHYARTHSSASPLMFAWHEKEYLGAAHGLAGILQALLCFPDFIQSDSSIERDVRRSIDFLLSCQGSDGYIPSKANELECHKPEDRQLYHWCHGTPGVVHVFAKAYLVWKEDKYLTACIKCADVTWTKGLLRKGPGICHGVAGCGYVFLLMYRLTKEKKYLYQAVKFAEFIKSDEFYKGARTPDRPYSLFEGLAGTLCFIVDLLEPEEAAYPLYDVF